MFVVCWNVPTGNQSELKLTKSQHLRYTFRLPLTHESPVWWSFSSEHSGTCLLGGKWNKLYQKISPGCVCESNEPTSLWWTATLSKQNTVKVKLSKPPITNTVTKDIYKRMSHREQPQILEDSLFLLAADQGNWDSPTQIRVHKPAVLVNMTRRPNLLVWFHFHVNFHVARFSSTYQDCGDAGSYPRYHKARGEARPRQVCHRASNHSNLWAIHNHQLT